MNELHFDPDHTIFLDNNVDHVQVENVYNIRPFLGEDLEDSELLSFLEKFEVFLATERTIKIQNFIKSFGSNQTKSKIEENSQVQKE